MHRSPPPFLIQNPRSFRLAPKPVFLPKTSTEVALTSDLEITAFYPDPTNDLERGFHLMCPVRALHIYLRRTEHSRGANKSLFVHWDEGRAHRPVSKQWISSTLTEVIHSAYCLKGREHEIISANQHLIWGVATSWTEIPRVPASEIRRAATWSGQCTFAQFYRLIFLAVVLGVPFLKQPHAPDQHKRQCLKHHFFLPSRPFPIWFLPVAGTGILVPLVVRFTPGG